MDKSVCVKPQINNNYMKYVATPVVSTFLNPIKNIKILGWVFPITNMSQNIDYNIDPITFHLLLNEFKKVNQVIYNYKSKYYECNLKNRYLSEQSHTDVKNNLQYLTSCMKSLNNKDYFNFSYSLSNYVNKFLEASYQPLTKLTEDKTYYKKLSSTTRDILNTFISFQVKHKIDLKTRSDEIVSYGFNNKFFEFSGIKDISKVKKDC